MLRIARHVHERTGMRNLCLAGGVALNCVANGRILREGRFENIWIQPAAGDAGGALGVAYFIWHQLLGKPRAPKPDDAQHGSLLGPSFADDGVRGFLDGARATYECAATTRRSCDRTARLMADGKVIGWFQGRMRVRAACARLSQHSRRPAQPRHADDNEREDQVPRIVPAVRAGRAARARQRLLCDAAERRQPVHAVGRAGARTSTACRSTTRSGRSRASTCYARRARRSPRSRTSTIRRASRRSTSDTGAFAACSSASSD